MLGLGVSSFSHLGGVHFQNERQFDPYVERLEAGELPIHRALVMNEEEKMIREFVLQMKLGRVGDEYFRRKFGVSVFERFREPLERHQAAGHLRLANGCIEASRSGLLQMDRLLHDYFLERHRDAS